MINHQNVSINVLSAPGAIFELTFRLSSGNMVL